jgi:DNA-binding transcriptional LysR family regulator
VSVPVGIVVRDGIGLVDAGAGGGGVVRAYEFSARGHIAAGRLKVLMPDWSSSRQPVYAAYPRSRHVPGKVRALLEFAQSLTPH